MKNIFDLYETDDLPESVVKHLAETGKTTRQKIIELFSIKSQLTADEIWVGLIRKYDSKIKRSSLGQILYQLKYSKITKNVSVGTYALCDPNYIVHALRVKKGKK